MTTGTGERIILVTGAAGNIGTGFREEYLRNYRGDYRLRLTDHDPDFKDDRFDEVVHADLGDFDQLSQVCEGVHTVVHLAANPDWKADFCGELVAPNISGAYNIFEAARQAACRRMVYASSVHAIMGYPVEYQAHHDDPPRPDTLYGVTKVFGEALCSSFSYLYGLSCIAIRIGAYVSADDQEKVIQGDNPQMLDIVVTQRDLAQLIHKCILAREDIQYAIVNGLSKNRYRRMDIDYLKFLLGYEPEDDAFEWSQKVHLGPEEKM